MTKFFPLALVIGMAMGQSACDWPTKGDRKNPPPPSKKSEPVTDPAIALDGSCSKKDEGQEDIVGEDWVGFRMALDNAADKENTLFQCTALPMTEHSLVVSGQCYRCLFGNDSDRELRKISVYQDNQKIETLSASTTGSMVFRKTAVDPKHALIAIPVQNPLEEVGYPTGDVAPFLNIAYERALGFQSGKIRVALAKGGFSDTVAPVNYLSESAASAGSSGQEFTTRQFLIYSLQEEDLRGGTVLMETEEGGIVTMGLILHKLFPQHIETDNGAWVVEQILSAND